MYFSFYIDQPLDKNSNILTIYIFLSLVLLALIIVIILLVCNIRATGKSKSSRGENDKETENQDNDDQTLSEDDVYTEPDQNRELDDSRMSFIQYENSNEGFLPLHVIDSSNIDYINEPIITRTSIFSTNSQGYEIPDTNNTETENQGNNDQTMSESDEYTELDRNREPDNFYMSLVQSKKS